MVFGHGIVMVRSVRLKKCMRDRDLILRLYRFRDLPVLSSLLTPEIFVESNGMEPGTFGSVFSFWIWLKATFNTTYVIELEERDGCRIIGLIGLYDMTIGRQAWLSLALFDPRDRGRGYGRQALNLLFEDLQKNRTAREVLVEVSKRNLPSLRFFRKLGFKIYWRSKNRIILEKSEIAIWDDAISKARE
jgi:RimJ/RimL family protein N-acetyltransferase